MRIAKGVLSPHASAYLPAMDQGCPSLDEAFWILKAAGGRGAKEDE